MQIIIDLNMSEQPSFNNSQEDSTSQLPGSFRETPLERAQRMIEPGNPKLKSVLMEGGNPLNNSNMINSKNDVSNNLNVSKKSAKGASARGKKEAKKLQKYDSNSIDEEEFQDYFSNPQKRKEFDRQRLQQQVKEIHSIAGFSLGQFSSKSMKSIREAFPVKSGIEEASADHKANPKNYATVAMCCLSVTNPFRSAIIQLVVINPYFDYFILCIILLNCVSLALTKEVDFVTDNESIIDNVFLIIYTMEMVLKIIAMGFVCRQHSYLRAPENLLDFVVVILGWVSSFYSGQDVSAVRTIRILRPLKATTAIPGMKSLISTIFVSLPSMFDIMVLFTFMVTVFGTVATQLLMGRLRNRCMMKEGDKWLHDIPTDKGPIEVICNTNDKCQALGKERGFTQVFECREYGNPLSGTFQFDTLLYSVLNIFQIITLENWSEMMYLVREAEDSYAYDMLFILIVLLGAYFVMNLMIAVQFTYLSTAFDEEDREKAELAEKLKLKKQQRQMQDEEDYYEEDENPNNDSQVSEQENNNDDSRPRRDAVRRTSVRKKGCARYCQPTKECRDCRTKVQTWHEKHVETIENVVQALIVLNTLFLASEFYNQPDWLTQVQEIGNFIFTFAFALEMLYNIFVYGFQGYFTKGQNIFDATIVIISFIELLSAGESSGLSVLRAFRILRILKVFTKAKELQKILLTILNSVGAIGNLGVLMILFIFIIALLMKQFYGADGPMNDSDGEESRFRFDTTMRSIITVFIILTGEEWNTIMNQAISHTGNVAGTAIFFIVVILLGNYIILNLFLAILLRYMGKTDEETKEGDDATAKEIEVDGDNDNKSPKQEKPDDQDNKDDKDDEMQGSSNSNIEIEFERIKEELRHLSNYNLQLMQKGQSPTGETQNFEGGDEFNDNQKAASGKLSNERIQQIQTEARNASQKNKSVRKKADETEVLLEGTSLYLFGEDNTFRWWLAAISMSKYFENFIMWMIGLNSMLLFLDTPILADAYQKKTISFTLTLIAIIFIAEAVMKIIAQGFIFGKKAYLKEGFNQLDFVLVTLSIVNWIIVTQSENDISFIRSFRALRALKPLRVVSKNEGIKIVVDSLVKSIPSLLNVVIIILLFLGIFAILGVQLLKGSIGTCNDETIMKKVDCNGKFDTSSYDKMGNVIAVKEDRVWSQPFNNYDNVFISMLTFFEISTLEMWSEFMFNAMDSKGLDLALEQDASPGNAVIYISFIFVTSFFVMNLFISVIVDKFNDELKERQGAKNFTQEQKEWVKIQRLLVHTNPKKIPVRPIMCLCRHCFDIVQSSIFEYFIMAAIVINTVFLAIEHYNMSNEMTQVLEVSNLIFVAIFTIEMILKITAYGFPYYWHVNWNKFDFFIVILSLVSLEPSVLENLNVNITALRIIRVSRLFRMVKTLEGLRSLLKTLYMSLGNILMTASLLLLILFTFSVAGMSMFGKLPLGEYINKNSNFTNFYLTIMTLWRACTGDAWNGLMHETVETEGFMAIVFWMIFQLFTFFVFMNVFIAVIYESFTDIRDSDDDNDILSLKKRDIKAFQNTWAKFQPTGDLKMYTLKLPDFLRELPPPLGYQGIRIEDSKLNKIIFCLNIRDHKGYIYYPEVMWTIFHSIVGINDDQVNNCSQVRTILKIVRQKYKELGKNVTLDSLCGNKYYRNDLTAIKYIQAWKILKKWKDFKSFNSKKKAQQAIDDRLQKEKPDVPHSAPLRNSSNEESKKLNDDEFVRRERVENITKQTNQRRMMEAQKENFAADFENPARGDAVDDDSMSDEPIGGDVTERNPMSARDRRVVYKDDAKVGSRLRMRVDQGAIKAQNGRNAGHMINDSGEDAGSGAI